MSYYDNISENALDFIDNPTYHFRLFLAKERGHVDFPAIGDSENIVYVDEVKTKVDAKGTLKRTQLVLLAETGGTSISLDSVDIETIPSMSPQTKTGTATSVSFTIKEPNSATFLDDMKLAALSLSIDNFQKCTYYLELTFLGRTEPTSVPTRLNKRWIYPLAIAKMNIGVDSSGANYECSAIVYPDHGYGDTFGTLPAVWASDNSTKTAYDALRNLEKFINPLPGLNTDDYKSHPNKARTKNRYYFILDKSLKDIKLATADKDLKYTALRDSKYYAGDSEGEKMLKFPEKTSLTDVVDSIMSLTTLFKPEKIQKEDVNDDGEKICKDGVKFHKLYKIQTKSSSIDFNSSLPLSFDDPPISGTLSELVNRDEFKKVVGLNPITDDYSKCIIYYITSFETPQIHTTTEVTTSKSSKEKLDSVRHLVSKRYDYIFTGLNTQVHDFDLEFNTAFYQSFPIYGKSDDQRAKDAAKYLPPEQQKEIQKQKVLHKSPCAKSQADLTAASRSTNNDKNNLESTPDGSRSFFNSIMSQSMQQGSHNGDMMNIDLSIKGDPSWLNVGYVSTQINLNRLKLESSDKVNLDESAFAFNALNSSDTTKPVIAGDVKQISFYEKAPMIIFRALPPARFDDDTGLYKSALSEERSQSLINGLYYVTKVNHSFEMGNFTQSLQCFRENRVNGQDVEKELNGEISSVTNEQFVNNYLNSSQPFTTDPIIDFSSNSIASTNTRTLPLTNNTGNT